MQYWTNLQSIIIQKRCHLKANVHMCTFTYISLGFGSASEFPPIRGSILAHFRLTKSITCQLHIINVKFSNHVAIILYAYFTLHNNNVILLTPSFKCPGIYMKWQAQNRRRWFYSLTQCQQHQASICSYSYFSIPLIIYTMVIKYFFNTD